jgi:hypothetical protein
MHSSNRIVYLGVAVAEEEVGIERQRWHRRRPASMAVEETSRVESGGLLFIVSKISAVVLNENRC